MHNCKGIIVKTGSATARMTNCTGGQHNKIISLQPFLLELDIQCSPCTAFLQDIETGSSFVKGIFPNVPAAIFRYYKTKNFAHTN